VKTRSGIELLKENKYLEILKEQFLNKNSSPLLKRSALWAIGNIGYTEEGVKLVIEEGLIETIINGAE